MKMSNLGKIWIVFALIVSVLSANVVDVKLSNDTVPKGSLVQLDIIAHGNDVKFPTITQVGDAPVVSQDQAMKIYTSNINGKSVTDNQKILTLSFVVQDDMKIPPFSIQVDGKEYQTKPLVIHTTKALPLDKKPFYLKFEAKKHKVFVDEPFVVSVYFVVRNDVVLATQPRYNPPKFDGFFVSEPKQKSYQNATHSITQIDYVLTPKAEGNYTITPPSAKVAIADGNADPFFGFSNASWHQITTKPITISVEPKPDNASLIGDFKVIAHIDKESTKANKPVNLSVKIFGEGSLDDVELPSYDIDGVSVYSDDATIKSEVKNGKIYSSYIKTYAFISDHDFDIPKHTIKAYSLATHKEYNLTIPSYHISVKANQAYAMTDSSTQTPQKPVIHTNIDTTPKETTATPSKVDIQVASWWSLLLAFVAGALAMFGFGRLNYKFKTPKFTLSNQEALKVLYPHISEDKAVEEMVRKLYAKESGDKSIQIDKNKLKEMVMRYKPKA